MLVVVTALSKHYRRGKQVIEALKGINLGIEEGEFIAIMGPSGCGKSTLLHLLGGLDRPTSGSVVVADHDLSRLDEEALAAFRRHHIGFVFQFFNLLPTLSAQENVALPLVALGMNGAERRRRALEALEMVGLAHRASHKPHELSGGEQQRVAIARAIVARPKLILADEPTGDLDSQNAALVVALLKGLNRDLGLTLVVATHNPEVAAGAHRTLLLRDGQVIEERLPWASTFA